MAVVLTKTGADTWAAHASTIGQDNAVISAHPRDDVKGKI
jgi:hypothetical protein